MRILRAAPHLPVESLCGPRLGQSLLQQDGFRMTFELAAGALVAAIVLFYLVAVLARPERF